MKKDILFRHVKCSAAIYEIHNGIGFCRGEKGTWYYTSGEEHLKKINFKKDPVKRLSKKYLDLKKIQFSGFIVGIKSIRLSADILITNQTKYKWEEVKLWRENEKFIEVAIVYYANNRKRLVPVEYCEVE